METFDFRGQNYEFMLRRNKQFKLFLYEKAKKLLFAFSFSARYGHKNKGCTDIVRHIPKKIIIHLTLSRLPKPPCDVFERTVRALAIQALVGRGRLERALFGAVRAELHVVERSAVSGPLIAAGVPAGLEPVAVPLLHSLRQPLHGGGIVVAAHKPHAGHLAFHVANQGKEAFLRQFLADVVFEIRAVTAQAAVRAKRKVDGQRHLVGKLLEDYIVVDVFKHLASLSHRNGVRLLSGGRARSSTRV